MREDILIINESNLPAKHKAENEPYEYIKYEVTSRDDFQQCYIALYEIPPLKYNYPYHYHISNTEAFYIISGTGILETPEGNKNIISGDIIICPPTVKSAHRIRNNSNTEILRYIDFDTINSPDIIHYPHSNKTGIIIHNQSGIFYKDSSKVEYYDGE